MAKELMTVEQAAELKGVTRSSVYAAVNAGRLAHVRVLGRIGLKRSDVMRWTPRRYKGRAGVAGGRPKGIPASAATKQRIAEAQRQRWALRQQSERQQA